MGLITVWDDRYSTAAAPMNSTSKQAEVVRVGVADGLLVLHEPPFDADETWSAIAGVHSPKYVAAVKTGKPRALAESQGFEWSPAFADSVARIWNGQVLASRLALLGTEANFVFHPVSGAHHAKMGSGGSFCTFNFLAGAALRLLYEGAVRQGPVRKVAIVDLDAHQGNGTLEWVRVESRLATFDIAGDQWGVSHVPEWGVYRVVKDVDEYERAIAGQLEQWIDETRPDLVFYQAGVDCWEHDPMGGIPGVTAEFLAWRDDYVLSCLRWIPTVINLGGGYAEGFFAEVGKRSVDAVSLHVQTARIAAEKG